MLNYQFSFFRRLFLSSWISVSSWFNSCIIWLRSSSYFRNNWFADSILGYCCNRKRSFSASVCSDEKTSETCCCNSTDGFFICPVSFPEWVDSGICNVFCCVFSVGFGFGSTDVSPWRDSVSGCPQYGW